MGMGMAVIMVMGMAVVAVFMGMGVTIVAVFVCMGMAIMAVLMGMGMFMIVVMVMTAFCLFAHLVSFPALFEALSDSSAPGENLAADETSQISVNVYLCISPWAFTW